MKLTGIVQIKIDGTLVQSMPGAVLNMGGYTRTLQNGHKVYGYSEAVAPADITFTAAWAGGDDIQGIAAKVDATMEFISDTGDTYIGREQVSLEPPVLNDNGGGVNFHFGGPAWEPSK